MWGTVLMPLMLVLQCRTVPAGIRKTLSIPNS